MAEDATDRVEESGYTVFWNEVPEPGHHFVQDFLPTILLILGFLSVLALVLSGFLVINVISAILTQQTRQIGVMKAIGAQTGQITGLYMRMVVAFGLTALLIAIPLGVLGANVFARFIAGQLNFDLVGIKMPTQVLAIQILVGLLAPILAALYPILHSAQMTVYEAIQDQGLGGDVQDGSHLGSVLQRLQGRLPLSRPLRLSLRNTFRRRGRLVRTLIPLILGGAIFMSVLTVRASLFRTLEDTLVSQGFDVQLKFDRAYRIERIEAQAAEIDHIDKLESWTVREGIPIHPGEREGKSVRVYAVPPDTRLLEPEIEAGRWLQPGDANAIVISSGLLFDEKALGLGETITLRIDDEETDWEVVGINRVFQPAIAPSVVYVSQDYYWRELGGYDHTDTVRVLTTRHDPATHAAVVAALEERLGAGDIEVVSTRNATEDRNIFTERFNILTVILMLMAFLLATVGSLGLLGAMSINVLERRREIGVMRAIGASNQVILRIFMVEGILIGLLSWVGGVAVSQLMGRLISRQVGITFARLPLTFVYDLRAPLLWLLIMLVIATLSSLAPARNAVNVSVRETLDYE